MKISVVIPMYNSRETIVDALNSIKNQTAINYICEIIVVNDGSTDDSLEIVKEYAQQNPDLTIKILNKANGGVSSARNRGIELASGDWIALLDSDDEWLPRKIEVQIGIISQSPEIDFLGGPFNGEELRILWKKIDTLYKASVRDICIKNFPQPSTVIFKKKIYDEIGGFDETQNYCEDANYFLKICSKYNLYYYPELLIVYGRGKRGFGDSGLSANLSGMYKGTVKNIKELLFRREIGYFFYIFLRIFNFIKYIRRILIVKYYKYFRFGD
ncbi:glycosyltransferase family 2 protein [Acetivibrio clariflavus]|uniref:Glycosyl transferase n=1 Tax=Acetivibrio clariflavus (strain DSM 19732 / NBRC 101661 / EBR45) TaxID=720554 RepID=G8LUH3_ACECE|nr:glycosyltransferase family A protein [Acetivibrio clariflavus]AEV70621.1 glycosyl transferase [Acetivibrio clariflavus DSM 19732]